LAAVDDAVAAEGELGVEARLALLRADRAPHAPARAVDARLQADLAAHARALRPLRTHPRPALHRSHALLHGLQADGGGGAARAERDGRVLQRDGAALQRRLPGRARVPGD